MLPAIDDETMNEDLPADLEFMYTVMLRSIAYMQQGHNVITARIGPNTQHWGALVSIEVDLVIDGDVLARSGGSTPLMQCWTDWPPHKIRPDTTQHALVVWNLNAPDGVHTSVSANQDVTVFTLSRNQQDLPPGPTTLRIKFDVSNSFFYSSDPFPPPRGSRPTLIGTMTRWLGERTPLTHMYFSVGIQFGSACGSYTLFHLDIPDAIAVRSRVDNADFYALSLGGESHYRRNTSLFGHRRPMMDYTFGSNDPIELSAPGFPPLRVGLGFILGGLALHILANPMDNPPLLPLASILLSLSLAAWFIEAFRKRRLFFPSSVVDRTSLEEISSIFFGSWQLTYLIATALSIGWFKDLREPLSWVGLGAGIIFVVTAVVYFGLLWLGTLQRYACDVCRCHLFVRRKGLFIPRLTYLDPQTRRAMCGACWRKLTEERDGGTARVSTTS